MISNGICKHYVESITWKKVASEFQEWQTNMKDIETGLSETDGKLKNSEGDGSDMNDLLEIDCNDLNFIRGLRTGLILSAILWIGIIYLVVK